MTHFLRASRHWRGGALFATICVLAAPLSAAQAAQPAAPAAQPASTALPSPIAATGTAPAGVVAGADSCPPLLDRRFTRLQDEAQLDLCRFAGKVVLVVNTASYCGFTKQYQGLENLYARYADRGLVVLGFPSNDFKQEAGSNREIA
ncbi:MAG TPA: hypothetical protein PK177_07675, partial [Burkholderiaceae bacterium]|nr:hypothetical protein [Burkholderiaceae bacterium]